MKRNLLKSIAPIVLVFLLSQCMIVGGIGTSLTSKDSGSNGSLFGLLGLGGGGTQLAGNTETGGTAVTGNTASPTVSYSAASFSYPRNVAITALTPTITATPLTNCSSSPTLPTGLALAGTTCEISGTPTVVSGATVYSITASNSFGTGNTTLSIQITATGTAPTVSYTGSPYTYTQNSAISTLTPTLGGSSTTSCSSSPTLPSGLSINATTCAISGTPTGTQGATGYTITATNAFGSGTANINITVSAAGTAPTVSYLGSPFTYTQNTAITTLTPTLGGSATTSCSSSPTLPTGLSINATTCAISGTPTGTQAATGHTISATNAFGTGTANINIRVNAAGSAPTVSYSGSPFTYTQNSAVTTLTPTLGGSATTSCSSAPTLPAGLSINATSCAISGTPTGTQAATGHTISATNAFGTGTTSINITVNAAGTAPTVSYSGSPFTYVNSTAITTLTPTLGGSTPTGCSSSPTLPTGLSINATSCAISGTPTANQGATTHTITATNAFGNGTASISIAVTAGGVKVWTRLAGVATKLTWAYGVTSDSSGNVYTTGYTNGSLDGQSLTGVSDLFVVKFNSGGVKQWTRLLGVATKGTRGTSITSDSSGNVYTSGYTQGNLDGIALSGTDDLFVVKYNASGVKQWTRLLGVVGGAYTRSYGITTDTSDNVYLTGNTFGNLDGQTGSGGVDMFVVKYNSSGVKQWTRLLGGAGGGAQANGIIADSSGNVYSTGWAQGPTFDGQTITSSGRDFFVVKFNTSGVKQWSRLLGIPTLNTEANSITSDSSGNVYTTGQTIGNLDGQTSTGAGDLFITKYDSSGVKQWTRLLGVSGNATYANGITTDPTGNVYAAGNTLGNLDGQVLTGNSDLFVVKYNPGGVKQWTKLLGVAGVTVGASTAAFGIGADANGNLYCTGYTQLNLDGQVKTGTYDLFVVKYQ